MLQGRLKTTIEFCITEEREKSLQAKGVHERMFRSVVKPVP